MEDNQTKAMVYDHMPLVRANPMTDTWKKVFCPEPNKLHFWTLIIDQTPKIIPSIPFETVWISRVTAKLFGYYGYVDPGTNNKSTELELSLPKFEQIVRTVLKRLAHGDPKTGKRTLNDTCLTYKCPDETDFQVAAFSEYVRTHLVTFPIIFEEVYP